MNKSLSTEFILFYRMESMLEKIWHTACALSKIKHNLGREVENGLIDFQFSTIDLNEFEALEKDIEILLDLANKINKKLEE